ncbi:MAG TPA: hypothetical protein VGW96_01130 [Candidatus Eremiobacteraceae bacterium]|nr:hypothetical protein [Candidatus Eremiobacteraceae bacterium]
MRSSRSPFIVLWVVAVLWAGAFAPTHAAQGPSPFPSPVPSGSPTPTASPSSGELSNPFPSPSPTFVSPSRNGYFAAGYVGGSANGGQVAPLPNATTTPYPFPASGSSGFWIDIVGRIAPSYLVALMYDNLRVHGADKPLVSYAQGRVLFQPRVSRLTAGVGLVSVQRSTTNASLNGFGPGLTLLPDFRGGLTTYGSLFYYPRIQGSGLSSTFTSLDAGLMYAPKTTGGLFLRVGGSLRSGFPASTSPGSITALQLGAGTSF